MYRTQFIDKEKLEIALQAPKVSGALEKWASGNLRQDLESLDAHCITCTSQIYSSTWQFQTLRGI